METVTQFPRLGIEVTRPKTTMIAVVMSMVMLMSGFACNVQQWTNILQQDLPILIQMAAAIAQIVPLFGVNVSTEDTQAITAIGDEATKDLQLLQTAYSQYQSSPTADNKQKIEAIMQTILKNLPALLQAVHVKDEKLLARVTAGVGLIVGTVNTILSLISPPTAQTAKVSAKASVPTASALKAQWAQQVGVPLK